MKQEIALQVLFEEDKVEGNVTAYIPALRLGVRGNTHEDARENATGLVIMEIEQGRTILHDTAIVETIFLNQEISLQVLFEEDRAEGNVTAYIPALRLDARGDTHEEARENSKELAMMAIEHDLACLLDSAIVEKIKVNIPVRK